MSTKNQYVAVYVDPRIDDSKTLRNVTNELLALYSDELFSSVRGAMGSPADEKPTLLFAEPERRRPAARMYVAYVPAGSRLASSVARSKLDPLVERQGEIPLFVVAVRPEGSGRLADDAGVRQPIIEVFGHADPRSRQVMLPDNEVNQRAMVMFIEQLVLAM